MTGSCLATGENEQNTAPSNGLFYQRHITAAGLFR